MKKNLALGMVLVFAASLLLILLIFVIQRSYSPEWHMLNVNVDAQGDANLIIDNGTTVLIDVGRPGPAKTVVLPYLEERKIQSIDHVFISHPHTDHYGGIAVLLEAGIIIHNVYYNMPPDGVVDWDYKPEEFLNVVNQARAQGAKLHSLSEGQKVTLPSSSIEVLYARKDAQLDGESVSVNGYSALMRWSTNSFSALFTGDLDKELGMVLANDPLRQNYFKADILKIPHHGVSSIAPNSFFNMVDPHVLMIPSTTVLWNHPRGMQVRGWAQRRGGLYCHNGLNGTVVLTFTKQAIYAKSDKSSPKCPAESPLLVKND